MIPGKYLQRANPSLHSWQCHQQTAISSSIDPISIDVMPFAALEKLGFNPKLAVVDNRFSNPRDLAGKPTPPPPSFVSSASTPGGSIVSISLHSLFAINIVSQRAQLSHLHPDDLRPARRHRSAALEVPVYEPVGRCVASRRHRTRIVRKQ